MWLGRGPWGPSMCVWDACHRPCVCSQGLAASLGWPGRSTLWGQSHAGSEGWVTGLWAPPRETPVLRVRLLGRRAHFQVGAGGPQSTPPLKQGPSRCPPRRRRVTLTSCKGHALPCSHSPGCVSPWPSSVPSCTELSCLLSGRGPCPVSRRASAASHAGPRVSSSGSGPQVHRGCDGLCPEKPRTSMPNRPPGAEAGWAELACLCLI